MRSAILVLSILFSITVSSQDQEIAVKEVTEAANNYINTFYKVDTTLAYKSVHPKLRKVGWWFNKKKNEYANASEMPFDRLINLAKRWNAKGDRVNETSIHKVDVLDVCDKIAVAKVTAVWGIDYLNMVHTNDGWKIINIVWQSEPKFSTRDKN